MTSPAKKLSMLLDPVEVPLYQDPFHPVLKSGTPSYQATDEQKNYLKAILDICCSDSRFAQKAYDAIVFLLNQVEVPEVPVASVISAITPATGVIPFAPFTLSVAGTGFVPESEILWNGAPVPTTVVSATEVTAAVDISLDAVAADYSVAVSNPVGLVSNVLSFSLTAPVLLTASIPVKADEPSAYQKEMRIYEDKKKVEEAKKEEKK